MGNTDEIPKFIVAQIDWWEKIAMGLDSITNLILESDIRKWRQTELMEILIEHPEIRDSSSVLDSFYFSQITTNAAIIRLKAIYDAATKTTDSTALQSLYNENAAIYSSGTQEQNLQTLNAIYIGYYTNYMGLTTMPDSLKTKILNIATQCYVTGGPSVFYARSMYWSLKNDVIWDFADNCLWQTGFYKTTTNEGLRTTNEVKNKFKVYPNALDETRLLHVETSEAGTIELFNSFGQILGSNSFKMGINTIQLKDIPTGVIFYRARLENLTIETGKIVIPK